MQGAPVGQWVMQWPWEHEPAHGEYRCVSFFIFVFFSNNLEK